MNTGRQVREIRAMNWVALSADGKKLASEKQTGEIGVWNTTNGTLVFSLKVGDGPAHRAYFSADGKTLIGPVTVDEKKRSEIRFWDTESGQELRKLVSPDAEIMAIALSADDKLLATLHSDIRIRLWDATTLKELPQPKIDKGAKPLCLAFSANGKRLAAGTASGALCIWNSAGGEPVLQIAGAGGRVSRVSFAPDGKTLATRGEDGIVCCRDAATGKEQFSRPTLKYSSGDLAFTPDGKVLICGTGGLIHRWEMPEGKPLPELVGHELAVGSVAFSPDGKQLVTASEDGSIRSWDASGRPIAQMLEKRVHIGLDPTGHYNLHQALFSPDTKRIASSADKVRSIDAATGKLRRELSQTDLTVKSLCFSPDGRLLACSSMNGAVLYDAATGKESARLLGKQGGGVVAFSPDGKFLATGGFQGVRLWDVATRMPAQELDAGDPTSRWVHCLGFSPDGKVLYTGAGNGWIGCWDVASAKEVTRFLIQGHVSHLLVVSPDGSLIAWSGKYDGIVRVLEVATGKEVLAFTCHQRGVRSEDNTGTVRCLAFAPDGYTLACACGDGTALIWELKSPAAANGPQTAGAAGPKEMGKLWAELASDDAPAAYRAAWTLATIPEKTTAFLKERLSALPQLAERIARLIRLLDDDSFAVRESASRDLAELGVAAVPALQAALQGKPSAEVRVRVEALLEPLNKQRPTPEQEALRAVRSVPILERVGTKDAQEVLEMIGKGPADAASTRAAKAALERLTKRPTQKP
jgi:WD40 repeat protein